MDAIVRSVLADAWDVHKSCEAEEEKEEASPIKPNCQTQAVVASPGWLAFACRQAASAGCVGLLAFLRMVVFCRCLLQDLRAALGGPPAPLSAAPPLMTQEPTPLPEPAERPKPLQERRSPKLLQPQMMLPELLGPTLPEQMPPEPLLSELEALQRPLLQQPPAAGGQPDKMQAVRANFGRGRSGGGNWAEPVGSSPLPC